MRQLLPLLTATLLVCSCVRPQEVRLDGQGTSSAAHSSSSGSVTIPAHPIELPPEETASSPAPMTGTGALAERVTGSGTLRIGEASAQLTLTAFVNYGSRYSTDFLRDMLPRLEEEFVRPGTIAIELVVTPLKKYPNSAQEASALLCAATSGKGLLMHKELLAAKSRDRNSLLAIAKKLELPAKAFTVCLTSKETKALLDAQTAFIRNRNVTLIPTFFLNDEQKTGLPSYADLRGWITQKLRES